jgi:two-component system alkaline phosphatase synthesis response regulator PhoP
MKNQGLVLTREKIMNVVWGFDFEGESRTVDVHIRTLRMKLGDAGESVQTVRGVGYKFGG